MLCEVALLVTTLKVEDELEQRDAHVSKHAHAHQQQWQRLKSEETKQYEE